jgi:tuftelin-interacting protein 11
MPKLTREVENWDPRTDTVPIHAWLHPWLPLLGARMEPLFPPIRNKLAACLRDWHAADPSAHAMLVPWINVRPLFPVPYIYLPFFIIYLSTFCFSIFIE